MEKKITAKIDEELKEELEMLGYDNIIPYKELSPAFIGISIHDRVLCYDYSKIPTDIDLSIPLEEYHIIDVGAEMSDDDLIIFSEDFYGPAIIGITHSNKVVYDYDKMIDALAKDYANGDGKVLNELDDNEQYEYIQQAQEWIDYNTIRSLPYDIMNGKPMPIVIQDISNKVE